MTTPAPQNGPITKPNPVLSLQDVGVQVHHINETQQLLNHLNLDVYKGQTVALLGESGSGKTLAAYAVLGLLPRVAKLTSGVIAFQGQDLLRMPPKALRAIRGNKIGMVFQEPGTSLNPLFCVGDQIGETLLVHHRLGKRNTREQVLALMEMVGIPDPRRRYRNYPHQLSGGVRQRVVIAMALAARPDLLLADEPTSALDTTVQAQILDLLQRLIADLRMSVLLISHNMGIVAALADRVAVLYKGEVVEEGPVDELLIRPAHPYTQSFLRRSKQGPGSTITDQCTTDGGCPFAGHCRYVKPICTTANPATTQLTATRKVRCFLHSEQTDEKRAPNPVHQ